MQFMTPLKALHHLLAAKLVFSKDNYNSAQHCEIGIIGGSNSSSRINFGDKDDADTLG